MRNGTPPTSEMRLILSPWLPLARQRLKPQHDASAGKNVMVVHSAVPGEDVAGETESGIAGDKIADLGANSQQGKTRLEVHSAAILESRLVLDLARVKVIAAPTTANAGPRRDAAARQKLDPECRSDEERIEFGDLDAGSGKVRRVNRQLL